MEEKRKKAVVKTKAGKKVIEPMIDEDKYVSITIDDTEYKTLPSIKYLKRKPYVKPDPKKIYSVSPGTIVNILAKEGQKMEAGETIIILEAMKMMNRIATPLSGTIKKIHVKKGQVIPKQFLIAEIK
jgi:biotin carboxyl carrier protein